MSVLNDIATITMNEKNKSYKQIINLLIDKRTNFEMQKCGIISAYIANKRHEDLSLKLKQEFANHMNITKTLNLLHLRMNKK